MDILGDHFAFFQFYLYLSGFTCGTYLILSKTKKWQNDYGQNYFTPNHFTPFFQILLFLSASFSNFFPFSRIEYFISGARLISPRG